MSTSRAKAAATASTASRAGVAAAAPMFETHQARQETSVAGGVLHGGDNMTESVASNNDVSLETSIPDGAVSLESILCTEDLRRRPSRLPDYEKENRALVKLVSALAESPSTILQTLAETILDITQCDSAGLSLLTRDGKTPDVCGKRFYWPAIAGIWKPHVGGGTPRDFGPCGDVLDQNRTLLFRHFERRYTYFLPILPLVEECLLVPFYVRGKAVGTIWAIAHDDCRKFDAEDDRVMDSLGKFAASAYQALIRIEDLRIQVSEREKAEAEVRELARGLEAKIRRLVEANVVGIVIWNLDGAITAANDAFLSMVQYDREDLASGRVRWTDLTPAEWRDHDERAVADLKATGIFQPFEKEYFRKDGSRVTVLLGGALFEGRGNEGVAFVIDLTDRKRAEAAVRDSERRYREVEMELAHANRVATMGQLSASIAHEVNQPLAAAVTHAQAALRWLGARPPDLEEARRAVGRIVKEGDRASDVIGRIRALVKKAPPRKDDFEINEAIRDVIALTRGEVVKNSVSVETQLAEGLPLIQGDRVQLQQVILNLIINAVEAMSGVSEGARELLISTARAASDGAVVAVRDSGPGLAPANLERLFEAFYTTKSSGLGMGLSICRSIIEAHGGQVWASSNDGPGTTFQFSLPSTRENRS
ncbi:MAG TPA: ATP-binding protein [Sphingomicrobium sp.]|nr:ATP-binding protein [Sphingomicrobium sp.]